MSPVFLFLLITLVVSLASALSSAAARGLQAEAVRAARHADGAAGLSGCDVARAMLGDKTRVGILPYAGGDSYDIARTVILLAPEDFSGRDAAAAALACHEAGHALWFSEHPHSASVVMALRWAGCACFAGWVVLFVAGFLCGSAGLAGAACTLWVLGVICSLALCVLEADASNRAAGFFRRFPSGDATLLAIVRRVLGLSCAAHVLAAFGPVASFGFVSNAGSRRAAADTEAG